MTHTTPGSLSPTRATYEWGLPIAVPAMRCVKVDRPPTRLPPVAGGRAESRLGGRAKMAIVQGPIGLSGAGRSSTIATSRWRSRPRRWPDPRRGLVERALRRGRRPAALADGSRSTCLTSVEADPMGPVPEATGSLARTRGAPPMPERLATPGIAGCAIEEPTRLGTPACAAAATSHDRRPPSSGTRFPHRPLGGWRWRA
jgi:hypothetical protein